MIIGYLPESAPAVQAFFDTAFSTEVSRRPASAQMFLEELERVLSGSADAAIVP